MSKNTKGKLNNLISTNIDDEEREHELSFYVNDRIKLMKEILKIIAPKKLKAMAPNCMKDLDKSEINSMLLEELLGISNKRLKHIINGENIDEESSSTDPEDEKQPVDIISLDDITDSDDDFNFRGNTEDTKSPKSNGKNIKIEKVEKVNKTKEKSKVNSANVDLLNNDKVMSVLELLELQARARAIRSQLAIESASKNEENDDKDYKHEESDSEAVIVECPKLDEIVIESSDSESGTSANIKEIKIVTPQSANKQESKNKKIKIIRSNALKKKQLPEEQVCNKDSNSHKKQKLVTDMNTQNKTLHSTSQNCNNDNKWITDNFHKQNINAKIKDNMPVKSDSENDEIIINVDAEEMNDIVNAEK